MFPRFNHMKIKFLRKAILSIIFPLVPILSYGQLFTGLSGEELADAIRAEFTPGILLDDNQAKDTLYAKVFLSGDSVRCIYSDLARYLPAGQDPSQWLYGSGLETNSINLEHGWPQAKGAGEGTDGNTNMYHLFPSRTAINGDRANFPYSEIPDQQTTKWFYKDKQLNTKPGSNIDAYTEYVNGFLEPRESVKGDIARAMFYFWTIYRQDAIAADPFFFALQLDDFCQWHHQDPVDDEERRRDEIIASYQDDKRNPFIIDCSLVKRTYCDQIPECVPVSAAFPEIENCKLSFHPGEHSFIIEGKEQTEWQFFLVDAAGRRLQATQVQTNVPFDLEPLPSGVYFAFAIHPDQILSLSVFLY